MCDGADDGRAAGASGVTRPTKEARMSNLSAKILGPDDGRAVELTAIDVRFLDRQR